MSNFQVIAANISRAIPAPIVAAEGTNYWQSVSQSIANAIDSALPYVWVLVSLAINRRRSALYYRFGQEQGSCQEQVCVYLYRRGAGAGGSLYRQGAYRQANQNGNQRRVTKSPFAFDKSRSEKAGIDGQFSAISKKNKVRTDESLTHGANKGGKAATGY